MHLSAVSCEIISSDATLSKLLK